MAHIEEHHPSERELQRIVEDSGTFLATCSVTQITDMESGDGLRNRIRDMETGSIRTGIFAALFAALTAAGALIRVPVPPVPFTLQTLFVMLAAGLLGPVVGVLSQCLYLATGLLGLPVFSGGGGISYVFQPQFGYLLGMPVAALFTGYLAQQFVWTPAERRNRPVRIKSRLGLVYGAGTAVIYACGLAYLRFYTGEIMGREIDLAYLFWAGCAIFLPTDAVKIVAAAWLTERLRRTGIALNRPQRHRR